MAADQSEDEEEEDEDKEEDFCLFDSPADRPSLLEILPPRF